ncbi:MAG: DUF4838 domain-containing protein [Lentisphaeria bacterium]|nr:DUF4838 domain-containing protein [Lentisphaeria bacterium]
MKKFICAALLIMAAGAMLPLQAQPRFDRSGKKVIHELNGSNVRIVVQNTSPVTAFAAEELQMFLSQILGKKIPIAKTPGSAYNIYVGSGPFADSLKLDLKKLIRDGFYIKSSGKNIVIAGRDDPKANIKWSIQRGGAWSFHFERATLFGVYEFLERFCGARFYFPGELGTVVPRKKSLKLPEIDLSERPDMPHRRYSSFWDGEYFEGENRKATINPAKNINLLRLRGETAYLPCCHGMNGNKLLQRFGKSNPEYFALTRNNIRRNDPDIHFAGHICFSSNVIEELYQDLKAYLTGKDASTRNILQRDGKPGWTNSTFHKPYVDVMPQDSFFPCQCPKCKARYEMEKGKEGMASKMVWGTVNAWAKRMKAEGVPGKLSMMAYWPYRSIPEEKLEDNIVVMLAQRGPWQTQPEAIAADLDLLKKWTQKLNAKVHVWNYANKVSTQSLPGIPAWTPLAVGRYYQSCAPYIFGGFMESECDRFLYFALNHYIYCKVSWNSNMDYKSAMDEFYKLMFGSASKEMQSIMTDFENIWLHKITGRVINSDIGPVASIPSDNEIWNTIYSPKFLDGLDARFNAAQKKVKANSLEARRIELFRREFVKPLRTASKSYLDRSSAVNSFSLTTGKKVSLIPFGKVTGETVKTLVSAAYTKDALEVTFECEEPEMQQLISPKRRPDDPDLWRDSSVELFLDPAGDGKVYYQLLANCSGSLTDQRYRVFGKKGVPDIKWNSNAKVTVVKQAKGFTVKIAIPLTSLPGLKRSGFPINFCRNRVLAKQGTRHALYIWSPYAKGFHDLENFGKLIDAREELILDGSFDTLKKHGKTNTHWGHYIKGIYHGWIAQSYKAQGDRAEYDNKVFFSAPGALKLFANSGKSFMLTQYFRFKFKPNTRYRLKCVAKLDNVKPVKRGGGFGLNLWDDRNHFFPEKNLVNGSCDWTSWSFEFTTSAKVHESKVSYFRVGLFNANGTVWVDDISLMEVK